jgi:O-antigen/teichoic acid export membrane protein
MTLRGMIGLTAGLTGTRVAGALIGLAVQLLLARLLVEEEVGIVLMAMSAAALLSLAVTGGYSALSITSLARYGSLESSRLAAAFHAAMWKDTVYFALILAVAMVMLFAVLPAGSGIGVALAFACLSVPASALIRVNSAVANSARRFALSFVPDFIFRPGLLLLFLLVLWTWGVAVTVAHVLWGFVAANVAVAAGQAMLLGAGMTRPSRMRLPKRLRTSLRGRAGALLIVAAVTGAYADIVTMAGGILLPPEEVAVLGISVRLAAIAGFVIQATHQFMLPDLSSAMAKGERGAAGALLFRVNLITLSAMLACVAGAAVLGRPVLAIFGSSYEAGHWPLVVFVTGLLLRAAGGMNQHLLSLAGFQTRTAGPCLVAVTVLLGLAAALAPGFGVMGVAIAALAADFVWAALLARRTLQLTGRRGDIFAGGLAKESRS